MTYTFFGGDLLLINLLCRDGSAVVRIGQPRSAYIHPRLEWGQVCGFCGRYRLGGLAHRSGGSLQEETELEISSIGGNGLAVSDWMAGGGQKVRR